MGENDKEDIYHSSEAFANRVEEAEVPESIPWKDYYHGDMSKRDAEGRGLYFLTAQLEI